MSIEQTGKTVSDSRTELMHVVMPQHLNGTDRLFGGQLVRWIDEIALITARRHTGRTITTASIDNLRFREPVFNNDMVVLIAKVTYTGRTSLEIRVDSFVENISGIRKLINTAFLSQVAIDENGRPTQIPQLMPQTPQEESEFAAGANRKKMRIKNQESMYN